MDMKNSLNVRLSNDTAAIGSAPLNDEERCRLEAKLHRVLAWVGVRIPDQIVLDDSKVPLHQVIWDLVNKEKLSREDESLLLNLEEKLDKRLHADMDKVDTTENEALSDYSEAAGLLRAIITLKGVQSNEEHVYGATEMQRRMRYAKKEKAKRWMEFLRQMGMVNSVKTL